MEKKQNTILNRLRRLPLEVKILIVIVVCLIIGFGSYVVYSLNSETKALKHQHQLRSNLFSETLISGIRNIMLSGRVPYVRAFISEAREEFEEVGRINIFNNNAEEIFPAKNPHISIPLDDQNIKNALLTKEYSNNLYPIKNEASCIECHKDASELRGNVKLDILSEADWSNALLQIVDNAFQAIMLSGKGEFADTLLLEINELLGVNLIQVYDEDAIYVAFGDDDVEVNEKILEKVLDEIHNSSDFNSSRKMGKYHFSPMPNLESCHVCHGPDSELRGILAMEIQSNTIERDQVINSVIVGLKNLMRLQRASYVGAYIDEIRSLPFVDNFQIFDNGLSDKGYLELWVTNPDYNIITTDSTIKSIVEIHNHESDSEIKKLEFIEKINHEDYLTQMIPILNDVKCQACHPAPALSSQTYKTQRDKWKVRSVVKVSTSMKDIQEEISKNTKVSIIAGFLTLFFVAFFLRVFIKITVLKPLDIIGGVVDKIGRGDLSVKAKVKSKDEIGILAKRINSMIKGLQERLHLTKFVSEEAVTAVKKAGIEGLDLGGERKTVTVMETDIRGFTSMSEKNEPEEVVRILNLYLDKQTEIIQEFGGDIDKFIGDAVLATFSGEKMIENAIQCSINIHKEIVNLNNKYDKNIMIGIGINTGPIIMGAMGSKDRMDFTIIGDNVNLSSRLCDAAKPGEIIISKNTKEYLADNTFNVKKIDSIKVKGKEKPIEIFNVIVE